MWTDVKHLRSQLADLESIVMMYLIQYLPAEDQRTKKTKNEPPSRNRSKPLSHKKGDDINSHKIKASSDEESTSNEEQDSPDYEEGPATFPTKNQGVPRGRRVRGLVDLQTRLPEYQGLVSYRAYRLKDIEAVIDENYTGQFNGILKRLKHHFSYSFGVEIPLKVLDFLSTVKEAMDLNNVPEGVAAVILPYLVTGEDTHRVIAMRKSSWLKVPKYPAAVAWLLESNATDATIDAAADKFLTAKQNPGEGEDAVASRLRQYATEAGYVYKEDALVSRYLASFPRIPPTRSVDKSRLGWGSLKWRTWPSKRDSPGRKPGFPTENSPFQLSRDYSPVPGV
jgi:hypothetical protein